MDPFLGDTMDLLRRTPAVLRDLLVGLPASWLDTTDTPDGWRPRDVVGHLITGETTNWIARARRILDDGTSRAFDPFDRFEMLERDAGRSLDELVEQFAKLRAVNLGTVEGLGLSDADLDRRGLHPALGEVSLRELLATWSVHDLDHISQIYAGLAGSRDAAVGPWKVYAGILLRRTDPAAKPG
jgi:DinB family protein